MAMRLYDIGDLDHSVAWSRFSELDVLLHSSVTVRGPSG